MDASRAHRLTADGSFYSWQFFFLFFLTNFCLRCSLQQISLRHWRAFSFKPQGGEGRETFFFLWFCEIIIGPLTKAIKIKWRVFYHRWKQTEKRGSNWTNAQCTMRNAQCTVTNWIVDRKRKNFFPNWKFIIEKWKSRWQQMGKSDQKGFPLTFCLGSWGKTSLCSSVDRWVWVRHQRHVPNGHRSCHRWLPCVTCLDEGLRREDLHPLWNENDRIHRHQNPGRSCCFFDRNAKAIGTKRRLEQKDDWNKKAIGTKRRYRTWT